MSFSTSKVSEEELETLKKVFLGYKTKSAFG